MNITLPLLQNGDTKSVASLSGRTQSLSRPTKAQVVTWIILLVMAMFLSLRDYQAYEVGVHFDDADYVILSRSLLSSDRFGMIQSPGQPGPTPFPFGYPLLLAPLVLLFPHNLDLLKVPSLIATLVNATLLFWGWRWFSRTTSYWWGIAVSGLYVLSPLAIDLSRRIMSDPIFTSFCLLSMLFAEQAAQGRQRWWWTPVMSVLLAFAVSTRTVGVILLISIFAYLLIVRRAKIMRELVLIGAQIAGLLALVVLITPVKVVDFLPQQYVIYTSGGAPAQIQTILVSYYDYRITQHFGKDIRNAVLPVGGGDREQALANALGVSALPIIFGFAVTLVIATGYAYWFAIEGLSLFQLFSILYFGVLWLWAWEDPRLLYPIQSQLFFGLLLGINVVLLPIAAIARRTNSFTRIRAQILAVVVLALLLISVYGSARIENSRLHTGDLQARSSWLKSNTPATTIIMSEASDIDSLYSDRKAIGFPASASSAKDLDQYISTNHIGYILVAPHIAWQQRYLPAYDPQISAFLPLIAEMVSENRIALVYSSEETLIKVYKVY